MSARSDTAPGKCFVHFCGEPLKVSQYLFYKRFQYSKSSEQSSLCALSLGDFFFARMSADSDPCIAEIKLLFEDRANRESLCSLRLYFLPEQSPDGREPRHGEVCVAGAFVCVCYIC
ncbi:Bromo adjacenty domain containing protein-like protein [Leptotrombidium deliense]|uniref:Bromo adjacenty domain containing protein-like protein n=1 Tax=Leptotrombidium deliense TaxID=299467 RepID=A0A443SAC8_9ACAR|nr:Bromo adjacenty domain containing protein-like protein [Leptotrombidium deliense]